MKTDVLLGFPTFLHFGLFFCKKRRRFKTEVGINPKFVARLKRFNYINLCLTQNPTFSWQMFLDQGLFYDQSHFIKDYREFFGKNPTAQILENRQVAQELTA